MALQWSLAQALLVNKRNQVLTGVWPCSLAEKMPKSWLNDFNGATVTRTIEGCAWSALISPPTPFAETIRWPKYRPWWEVISPSCCNDAVALPCHQSSDGTSENMDQFISMHLQIKSSVCFVWCLSPQPRRTYAAQRLQTPTR